MAIIETLANTLKKHRGVVYNVLPITTAKVPIVKFKHVRTQLEGDISLYNTLVSGDRKKMLFIPSSHNNDNGEYFRIFLFRVDYLLLRAGLTC